jgi:hypothetical protein
MKRQVAFLIFVAQIFFFGSIQIFAQQTSGQQSPSIPDDVLGSRLIAWSQLQQPEPVVQGQSQDQRPSQPSGQASNPAQTFTDCTNIDCPDNHESRSIPSITNCADRSVLEH